MLHPSESLSSSRPTRLTWSSCWRWSQERSLTVVQCRWPRRVLVDLFNCKKIAGNGFFFAVNGFFFAVNGFFFAGNDKKMAVNGKKIAGTWIKKAGTFKKIAFPELEAPRQHFRARQHFRWASCWGDRVLLVICHTKKTRPDRGYRQLSTKGLSQTPHFIIFGQQCLCFFIRSVLNAHSDLW